VWTQLQQAALAIRGASVALAEGRGNGAGLVVLREYVTAGNGVRVDRARGVLRGCRALGWQSANGRRYKPEGVDPRLYEGVGVYIDHPDRNHSGDGRNPRDLVGYLENAERRGNGIFADLRLLNPGGEFEQRLLAIAEKNPRLLGLSHEARGRQTYGSSSEIESVESVSGVALVTSPATTNSLFESRNPGGTMRRFREGTVDPNMRSGMQSDPQDWQTPGMRGPRDGYDEPEEDDGEDGPEEALENGFRLAVLAVVDNDAMDLGEKVAKIRELLKAQERLLAVIGDGDEEETEAEESRRRRRVAGLRLQESRRSASPYTDEQRRQRLLKLRCLR
jgi:hypothetical protein